MTGLINPEWIQRLGLTALHFLWQGALLGAGAFFAARFIDGAAKRYAVLYGTLLAMAVCPILTWTTLQQDSVGAALISVDRSALGDLGIWSGSIWLVGICGGSIRLAVGWLWLRWQLHRRSSAPTRDLRASLARMSERLGVSRAVDLVVSPSISSPATAGFFKSVIYLPAVLVSRLSADQIDALLAHELAHIRRYDFAMNVLQCGVEVVLFFHPAVWWISNRIRVEREHCCDDLAIEAVGNSAEYASALLELEMSLPGIRLACAANDGDLLTRLRRLGRRDVFRPSRQVSAAWVLMLGLGLLASLGMSARSDSMPKGTAHRLVETKRNIVLVLGPGDRLPQHDVFMVPVLPHLPLQEGKRVIRVQAWHQGGGSAAGSVRVEAHVESSASSGSSTYEFVSYESSSSSTGTFDFKLPN